MTLLLPGIVTVTFPGNGLLIAFPFSGIVPVTFLGNGVCILFGNQKLDLIAC
jgi:hypothetical protein